MGKTITPRYRVEFKLNGKRAPAQCWTCENYGKPTQENLEKWRNSFNRSFNPGGCNWHITQCARIIPHITWCSIVEQKTGKVITEVKAPLFEIV